ncbi:hypothetical protein [Bacillus sp. UMB0893]|uniref:hypothetical protein n=1 Tax=Bacillus sp. UMB0893 TaxID=2066053 RepID=UPI001C6086FC|nr:hypothetical protein [Bacillus sp. UMB0893]
MNGHKFGPSGQKRGLSGQTNESSLSPSKKEESFEKEVNKPKFRFHEPEKNSYKT